MFWIQLECKIQRQFFLCFAGGHTAPLSMMWAFIFVLFEFSSLPLSCRSRLSCQPPNLAASVILTSLTTNYLNSSKPANKLWEGISRLFNFTHSFLSVPLSELLKYCYFLSQELLSHLEIGLNVYHKIS